MANGEWRFFPYSEGEARADKGGGAEMGSKGVATNLSDHGSMFFSDYRSRIMKVYSISEIELDQYFEWDLIVTICFSIGFGAFGYGLDLAINLSMAENASSSTILYWGGIRSVFFTFSAVAMIIGICFFFRRRNKVQKLKDTSFKGVNLHVEGQVSKS